MQQGKKSKGIHNKKEEIKLFLFSDDKVIGSTENHTKASVFLYISNENVDFKAKKYETIDNYSEV